MTDVLTPPAERELSPLLWLLNQYRAAEVHGAGAIMRMGKLADTTELRTMLSRHLRDEAVHAWLWTRAIEEMGGEVAAVPEPYQARLAAHYGIRGVYGSHFRRVAFADGIRGGLLGQGSVLTVTSYPNRTSVTMRGRWLLANILGAPPPPPPPDIPALKEAGADGQPRSLRERMELHRKNPACAACHQRMDPLGFALENFDALGKWREASDGAPIDPAAAFPDGSRFEGIRGLRALLSAHKEDFARTLAEKLLAYAIGRGLDYRDMPAVRAIARDAARADYSWSSIVVGIVKSPPFSMAVAGDNSGESAR